MKKFYLSIVLVVLWASSTDASTYYVDAARSNDDGAGTSWGEAEKTIAAGVAHLTSGDTLLIKSGTYTESIDIQSKSYSSTTTIQTDDGSGNPGTVTINPGSSGVATNVQGAGRAGIYIRNSSNVHIDGRQADGFTITVSSGNDYEFGVCAYHGSDTGTNVKVQYCTINGTLTGSGGEAHVIMMYGYSNVEIAYNNANVSSGTAFIIEMASSVSGCSVGSIHHNEVSQGESYGGYAVISILRFDQADVYSNYVHGITSESVYVRVRDTQETGSTGGNIYNNVFVVDSTPYMIFQCRGMSTGSGGSDGWKFYNNTADLGGYTSSYGGTLIALWDDSDSNQFFNNLFIGAATYGVATDGGGGAVSGTNNVLQYNVVTGNIIDADWMESATVANAFSTNANNTDNAGTSSLTLSGNIPYPYYDLDADNNGTGTIPAIDYNGDARADPPDVGAFEYAEGGAATSASIQASGSFTIR